MYFIFYFFVLISFIHLVTKYKNDLVAYITIFTFYSGLAAFPGKLVENPYKVLLLGMTIFAALKLNPFQFKNSRDKRLFIVFCLFSFIFFLSSILNGNNPILILSQYGKYLTPFILFYIFKNKLEKKPSSFYYYVNLFKLLLLYQGLLSIVKLFTIGITETTVGSIAYQGGGPATIIPILGFIFIWIMERGHLKSNNWYFILLLIFIAFMSVKRSIWFVMPVIMLSVLFYVPKRKIPVKILWIIPFLPILFYLGVRLNPTLNREQKLWGSFDFDYVVKYAERYSFGDAGKSGTDKKLGQGRGGATLLLVNKLSDPSNLSWQDFFGYGLEEFVTKDYENFNENKFGVNSRGSVTGFFNSYISFGFIGIILLLIYSTTLMGYIKNIRMKHVIFGIFLWEYFFYIGMILTTQAVSVLFIYLTLYLSKHKEIRTLPIIRFQTKPLKFSESPRPL